METGHLKKYNFKFRY